MISTASSYLFYVPFSTANPVTVPVGPSTVYKGAPVTQIGGGKEYYKSLLSRCSVSYIADKFNKSSPYISYETYELDNATGFSTSSVNGFELYFENQYAQKMWDGIFNAGEEFNIKPIGLGARDTLRLEMGFCLYGNDIDDTTSPIEAGLGWITKFNKEFTNKANIEQHKLQGVSKKLVGFEMIDRGIPRHDYPIADASGAIIGKVTSGTQSPSLNKAIGLGYVKTEFSKADTEIFIIIRDKPIKAKVCKIPFLKK